LGGSVTISSLTFTENSLIIEIDYKNERIFKIKGVYIDYENNSLSTKSLRFTEEQKINYQKSESKIVIYLDLTDEALYTNEEAKLTVSVSGGYIYGDIVIEDTVSNIETFYTFPNESYNNLRINILKQGYGLNR
jgi:hypothetical protein